MNKEQEKTLRAIKTGELAKQQIVVGGGISYSTQGVEKSFDAEKAFEIVNKIENSNLQIQKANQAQRA